MFGVLDLTGLAAVIASCAAVLAAVPAIIAAVYSGRASRNTATENGKPMGQLVEEAHAAVTTPPNESRTLGEVAAEAAAEVHQLAQDGHTPPAGVPVTPPPHSP